MPLPFFFVQKNKMTLRTTPKSALLYNGMAHASRTTDLAKKGFYLLKHSVAPY
jgi:hypothetical protein